MWSWHGSFQKPKIPVFNANIPAEITQLHSGHYRNPGQIPDGAVLVVGSGQSGMQIAEELYQNGRTVYLCTGTAPRVPRRYRGKDIVSWLAETGFFDQTVDKLPSPKARLISNPQATGKNGGHSLNLHQFARDGVYLFGHIAGVQNGKVMFSPDLKENLAKVDKAEKDIVGMIDRYIQTMESTLHRKPCQIYRMAILWKLLQNLILNLQISRPSSGQWDMHPTTVL